MSDTIAATADLLDETGLLTARAQVKAGDFSAGMPLTWTGVTGRVADALNEADLSRKVSADVRDDPEEEVAAVLIADDSPTPSSSATLESSAPHSADEPEAGWLLLAEDNPINQKVAVAMLSSAGYRVDTVLNGREAVAAAGKHPYDAILMDCQMPELNGYEATAAIRALEGVTRHTPIIALTAGTRAEDRDRCLIEGMDSYLAKPLNKDALVGMVTDAMAQDPHREDPFGTTARRLDDEAALDQAAFQELQQLGHVVESTFLVDLVEAFVEDTASLVMQLRKAHEGGDILAIMQIAHSIKGSSSQLGGRRLAEACAQLIKHPAAESERGIRDVEENFQELRYTLRRQLSLDGREDPGYSRV